MVMSNFSKLLAIDVNKHIKQKQRQSYLSWTYAWSEFKKACEDANYEVLENADGLPFFESKHGIIVKTKVTTGGETLSMWLPVMDGANRALKSEPYTYLVKEYVNKQATGKMIEKQVAAATMMDINKAIMRCLVKNIAMFGLGLYVFSGEDMPEAELLDSSQITEISNLCNELKVDLSSVNQSWGINKLSELQAINFDATIKWIKDKANEPRTN